MSTPQRKNPKHFFWDGKLHRVLRINRPVNLVEAWCFDDRQTVTLLFSDYRSRAKIAVQTGAAAKIMHVDIRTMKYYIINKVIHPISASYALDGKFGVAREGAAWNESKIRWWWGEHNLYELHDYLMSMGANGTPRKDGRPKTLQKFPTKAEIHAAFNNSTVLYVKGTDGDYVPVFNQPKW